jgi:hypothetical protein
VIRMIPARRLSAKAGTRFLARNGVWSRSRFGSGALRDTAGPPGRSSGLGPHGAERNFLRVFLRGECPWRSDPVATHSHCRKRRAAPLTRCMNTYAYMIDISKSAGLTRYLDVSNGFVENFKRLQKEVLLATRVHRRRGGRWQRASIGKASRASFFGRERNLKPPPCLWNDPKHRSRRACLCFEFEDMVESKLFFR